mmetsp:Transcript_25460/g.25234  ORF Transcript_25460/g.25234 Transcript_25460/m.25234 type:complete len:182 (+) Transcript_25460:264-809(+)
MKNKQTWVNSGHNKPRTSHDKYHRRAETLSVDRNLKILAVNKPSSIERHHYMRLKKPNQTSSRINPYMEKEFRAKQAFPSGREKPYLTSKLDKRRSGSSNKYSRKKLLPKDNFPEAILKTYHKATNFENHVTKFSFSTKAGKSLRNPKKKNQDQYIIEPIFKGMKDVHLFGVCDGHGINGK